MKFIQIIENKKYTLITIFMFLYFILNLLDGERGLISYYEKQKIKDQLIQEKELLVVKLDTIENKNNLLSGNIDIDYLEILYRKKFMFGKPNETIYKIN